jgi:predicted RNA-binding Zn ribbon-like protein
VDIPSWANAEENKPAPMPLLRVQSFINTLDLEGGTDVLLDPESAGAWLVAAKLVAPGIAPSPDELRTARHVREALRALARQNSDGTRPGADQLRALQEVADARRPAVRIDATGSLSLEAGDRGDLPDGLLSLLLTARDAQADGTWSRLKVCANPDCSWVFYDRSRNRQGTWCTMASCGNRLKNRRFRARGAGSKAAPAWTPPPPP